MSTSRFIRSEWPFSLLPSATAALQIGVLFAEMVSEEYLAARAELDRQWEAWSGRQDALAAEIATETGNWLSEDEQRAYEERRRELAGRIEEAEDPVEQALLRVELAGGDVEQMRRILEEARANGASPTEIQRLEQMYAQALAQLEEAEQLAQRQVQVEQDELARQNERLEQQRVQLLAEREEALASGDTARVTEIDAQVAVVQEQVAVNRETQGLREQQSERLAQASDAIEQVRLTQDTAEEVERREGEDVNDRILENSAIQIERALSRSSNEESAESTNVLEDGSIDEHTQLLTSVGVPSTEIALSDDDPDVHGGLDAPATPSVTVSGISISIGSSS